jgi:hypothetical protein
MAVTRTPQRVILNTGNVTWTNQPTALTEFLGLVHRRMLMSFVDVHRIRLGARISTAGVAASVLFAQYSTDESAWSTLTGSIAMNTTGTKVTTFDPIPAGAVNGGGDVFVRLVGSGGDGVADPVIGNVWLEYR